MSIECVREEIEKLGKVSSKTIAERLRKERITGEQGRIDICPIANFLKKKCKERDICVYPKNILVFPQKNFEEYLAIPLSVEKFIKEFDNTNKYKFLRK